MSQETFDEHKAAILDALDTLLDNPKSRRRFRLLALYAKDTGELLAEVFRTNHGPLILHRSRGTANRGRKNYPFPRQGRGLAELVVAPLTDNPDQRFSIMARHSQRVHSLQCSDFRDWIAEGMTRRTIG
jgi:hypothetical protein